MSGEKYSEYRLRRERAERLQLEQRIGSLQAECQALQARAFEMVAGVSEGLRTTFSAEVQQAQRWLDTCEASDLGKPAGEPGLDGLRAAQQQLDRALSQGREVLQTLTVALTQKADELGRRLAGRLARVEQAALARQTADRAVVWPAGNRSNRTRYCRCSNAPGGRAIHRLGAGGVDTGFPAGRARQARRATGGEAPETAVSAEGTATDMPGDAIRGGKACPASRRQDDRGAPMVYEVDTFDRGKITFRLTLERISTFAEVAEDRCFEEFDAISEFLEENFGIETEFQMADGSPRPIGRKKGEKDEPTGSDRQAGMSGEASAW